MKRRHFIQLSLSLYGCSCLAQKQRGRGSKPDIPLMMEASPASADFLCTELLAFPTTDSILIHLIPQHDMGISIHYGTGENRLDRQTSLKKIKGGEPYIINLDKLNPDTAYFYRMEWNGLEGPVRRFHTARSAEKSFTFAVQADPHLDANSNLGIYAETLRNIGQAQPDFLIDLGDTTMVDKLEDKSNETIRTRNLLLRNGYGQVAHSIPLFLVEGNHDGELGWLFDGSADSEVVRATTIRKRFYPVAPDHFYDSDAPDEPFCGTVRTYHAWTWGDALFVVIDPYRYTKKKPGKNTDGWGFTLGERQYRWLRRTLEGSKARHKFVFGHQLVGGDEQGRGGVEHADWYEWGGHDPDGTYHFDEKRPGWGKPIHRLLVDTGVKAYFHGHDHFYARQEKDGVIYQLVPQPAHRGDALPRYAADYGYNTGDLRGGSGFILVKVSGSGYEMEFVESPSARQTKRKAAPRQ